MSCVVGISCLTIRRVIYIKNSKLELAQLQASQVYILKAFDELCVKHDISYHVDFGSLIGAIRHQGFIPWDDDIDVSMDRYSYNKFLKVSSDLSSDFFIQNHETDPEYIHPFTRIRLNGTLSVQKYWADVNMHQGIFIDIFPFDAIDTGIVGSLRHYAFKKIEYVKFSRTQNKLRPLNRWENLSNKIFKHWSTQSMNSLQTKLMSAANKEFTNDTMLNNLSILKKRQEILDTLRPFSYFQEIDRVRFESLEVNIPSNYDKILTRVYGDYMTLPPVELQQPHHLLFEFKFRDDILALENHSV